MKELLAKPGFLADASTLGADVSYSLAVIFTGLFLASWRLAKKGLGTEHHRLIFISMVSMVVYFVAYYWARQLGVLALEGKEGFGGPESTYNNVFIPILSTHLVLVVIGLILTIYMIIQGFRASIKTNGEYTLKEGPLNVKPGRFKRVYLTLLGLWGANQILLTFVRDKSAAASLAWALIFATIAVVVSLEKLIENRLPDVAHRHRVLGRGTMIIYCLILVTSTLTYLMLYVIYPVKT